MSVYELMDKSGDSGMLVAGAGIDMSFRKEADAHNRPDERLITVNHPEYLLEHDMLVRAAVGQLATRAALQQS
ncbi:hypothetical protein H0X10_04135 [Candidatus Saccharibacteria bacterium]|nr:hypothetical protein [Candidatus Saccharibacteria bacterium]